ncbi:hypothetical protein [Lentzea flava]|uniref:Excreted virulence factor EspC, type VII ESX diderm n=1 Tax=Lentzea flava TaxID=103732 RepID=A0ABQ2UEK2_9PSEU|nr:hypothetical protein [Lentzea flava]MCP2198537.1 hypothetical protein [Lentzea flava]GGU26560.1 hypothetical protein GCM10010178_18670 [Lentzea flava]
MADFKVVTSELRKEAKLWQEKVDKTEPIVRAVQGAYLSSSAFFVGDLTTLAAGIANAELEAGQYEEFRTFMEKVLQGAVIEFGQIDVALRRIADEYDRTEGANEVDLKKFYSV